MIEDDDKIFRALANKRRRDILDMLKDEPHTTGDLCARFPQLNRCTIMQHLDVLAEANLIIIRRTGRLRWNYLNALPIKHIHDRWIGAYASESTNLLNRLKADLEAAPKKTETA